MSVYLSHLFSLDGQTALITGATRGLGAAIAMALAQAGANIILLVRNPSAPEVQQMQINITSLSHKPTCQVLTCDLNDRHSVTQILSSSFFSPSSDNMPPDIDILVNCGGIQYRSPAEDFPISQWDNILSVNLTSSFILAQSLGKYWLETCLNPSHVAYAKNGGRRKKIIFVASVTTFTGSMEIPAYVASKGAIGQLTKALNNEWMGRGINVNAIAPGYFRTNLTQGIAENSDKEKHIMDRVPAGRWGQPDDLAGAIIYLCSRASDFVGGEIHVVDGGFNGR